MTVLTLGVAQRLLDPDVEATTPEPTVSDGAADLVMVRAALGRQDGALDVLSRRLGCVAGIVSGLNGRLGLRLPSDDLADVVQDALVVVWRKLDQFRGEVGFEFWVYRICYLELMNGLRRRQRQARSAWHDAVDVLAPAARDDAEQYAALHLGLEKLGAPAADVIRLKFFEGLTFEEIARRLDMPLNTAKTYLYRGVKRLQLLIRPDAL